MCKESEGGPAHSRWNLTDPAVLTVLPLLGHDCSLEWAEFGIKGQEGAGYLASLSCYT